MKIKKQIGQHEEAVHVKRFKIWKRVEDDKKNTLCYTCRRVCHEGCGLREERGHDPDLFINCACMDSMTKRCGVCPGKCQPNTHYHGRFKYVQEEMNLSKLLGQGTSLQDPHKAIDNAIKDMCVSISERSFELKAIIKGFNFVEELDQIREQLVTQKKYNEDTTTRDFLEESIEGYQAIVEQLRM